MCLSIGLTLARIIRGLGLTLIRGLGLTRGLRLGLGGLTLNRARASSLANRSEEKKSTDIEGFERSLSKSSPLEKTRSKLANPVELIS